jgi:hypothetical protein
VGPALGRGNQVDVGLGHQLAALGQPLQGPVDGLAVRREAARERLRGQRGVAVRRGAQVVRQAILVEPLLAFVFLFIEKSHAQARAQDGLGPQHVLQARHGEVHGVEVLPVRREPHAGARIAATHRVDHRQVAALLAAGKAHLVHLAVAADGDRQLPRQGIDHGHAHPVQAAGELVVLVRELAAGVQRRQDHLDAGLLLLRVQVHGHAASVVGHGQGAVGVQHHVDLPRVAGECLVDAVIDNLLGEVVGARGIRVHARALAHRLESGQDLDGFRGILAHGCGAGLRREFAALYMRV